MCSDYWLDEGIECRAKHFISDDALIGYVASLSNESAGKHNGNVKCPTMNVRENQILIVFLIDLFSPNVV
jgi:hypothetical protein